MTDFDVVQAKKFFYSKDIKSAYEMFIKSEDYLYEAGLCALLLKDENDISIPENGYGVQYNLLIMLSLLEKIIDFIGVFENFLV